MAKSNFQHSRDIRVSNEKFPLKKSILILLGVFVLFFLVRYFYFKPMLVFGQNAPEWTAQDLEGKEWRLQDFRDYYLLIDFWGSWCKPCRQENPILAMLYDRYEKQIFKSAKGIQFISIALDENEEAVRTAILKDGLRWPHHILEKEMLNGPLAKLYGIRSVPHKYLIGPDGRIILANPDFKELDDFLAKDVKKN